MAGCVWRGREQGFLSSKLVYARSMLRLSWLLALSMGLFLWSKMSVKVMCAHHVFVIMLSHIMCAHHVFVIMLSHVKYGDFMNDDDDDDDDVKYGDFMNDDDDDDDDDVNIMDMLIKKLT
ncbi:hypothetical protein TIFTF001_037914 [Ficus carica]|uniref:Uncharacterized protein n=1 Tax=Ficus carica TaxID=3494 RepID=A0AA88E6A1_FICCA|nr:hypothetical protein TIFTF001_037914 [Ficus carica]